MAFLTKEKWWERICWNLSLKDFLMQNFHWHYLNQALLESSRGMESFLKLLSSPVLDFPLFYHFTSLSTAVGRSRESSPIMTFEKITFKFYVRTDEFFRMEIKCKMWNRRLRMVIETRDHSSIIYFWRLQIWTQNKWRKCPLTFQNGHLEEKNSHKNSYQNFYIIHLYRF